MTTGQITECFIKCVNCTAVSSGKEIASVQMLKNSLEKLQQVLELHGYDALTLLSSMILDVENLHSVVHHKDPLCMVLDYARNLEMQPTTVNEGLKRTSH